MHTTHPHTARAPDAAPAKPFLRDELHDLEELPNGRRPTTKEHAPEGFVDAGRLRDDGLNGQKR